MNGKIISAKNKVSLWVNDSGLRFYASGKNLGECWKMIKAEKDAFYVLENELLMTKMEADNGF